MANTTRPSVPPSHASESEHRRQIANVVNIINQTTPDYSRTAAEISAGVTPVDYRYPEGDVRRYGAVGDGTTDDTAAIQAAQAASAAGGAPVVFRSGKTYKASPLAFAGQSIDWASDGPEPATIYCDEAPSSYALDFSGAVVLTTTVAADAYPLDVVVELASVAGVQVGDLIKFVNTAKLWQSDPRDDAYEGQLAKVIAIDGTDVQLDASLAVGLPSGTTAIVYRPIQVRLSGIRLRRLRINGSSRGMKISHADNPQIINCGVVDATRIGLHLLYCYNGSVQGGEYRGANLAVSEQLGYGVVVESCYATQVKGIVGRECRRCVDITGYDDDGIPSWFCKVEGSRFYGGGFAEDGSDFWPLDVRASSGAGSHGPAYGTVYERNTFINCYHGLTIRGRDETVRNNLFIGAMRYPLWVHHGGGLIVENNRYTDQYEEGTATPGTSTGTVSLDRRPDTFLYTLSNPFDKDKHLTVRGNTARNVKTSLIYIEGAGTGTIANWIVCQNVVGIDAGSPGVVGVVHADSDVVQVINFAAWDNEVIAPADYTVLKYRFPGATPVTEAEARKIAGQTYYLRMPDDTAVRIRVGRTSGQISCKLYRNSANATPRFNGILRHESTTSTDWGGSLGVTVLAAPLTGTTGSDGDTSMAFAGDSVYVENRTGGLLDLILEVVGSA